jgi:hypothetical protein
MGAFTKRKWRSSDNNWPMVQKSFQLPLPGKYWVIRATRPDASVDTALRRKRHEALVSLDLSFCGAPSRHGDRPVQSATFYRAGVGLEVAVMKAVVWVVQRVANGVPLRRGPVEDAGQRVSI